MSIVRPKPGRAQIKDDGNTIIMIIPVKKNWLIIPFYSFWLCGWAVGEFMAPFAFFRSGTPIFVFAFVLAWLVIWTMGGLYAIWILLWNIFGQEIVTVNNEILQIDNRVFRFGRSREYLINETRNYRAKSDSMAFFSAGLRDYSKGTVKFDYGMKTFDFGMNIEESEALYIINLLKSRGFIKND
ncbi:MAG: hypothetical protein ACM3PP_04970 [Candidatus Saccharibacteria bacterium]